LNQDKTPPFEAVAQRHQQQKARGETELGGRWHQPDHCGLARTGGFHDAEHGLVIVDVGKPPRRTQSLTNVRPKLIDEDGSGSPTATTGCEMQCPGSRFSPT
jgi:hypothetical protein